MDHDLLTAGRVGSGSCRIGRFVEWASFKWLGKRLVGGISMTSEKPAQKASGQGSKWFWRVFGIFMMIGGVGVLFIPLWASIDVETIQCEVVSAEPETSSGGLRGSSSTAGVLVNTANCGDIYVSPGVTFKNQEEVAASFKAGDEYEFDIGWFSRVIMEGILDRTPSVQDYRLVP
ncbi:hypothetical protein ACIPVK_14455 [Paeniglutamicibacter sp. MACA_103]|uniref:hypothetical protein n=1 Tax=Paeniglutamicibacter sp. MACA_103 TaxID=3377337 RepID=UPI003894540B